MLKTDLHIHTKEDKQDIHVKYSAKELIDKAAEYNFDIISITHHNKVFYTKGLADYAKKKNIILIPGIEKTIKGKHVLIYNITQEQADNINSFEDLKKIKNNNNLIIAPHPYFFPHSLRNRLIKHIHLFDAFEYSSLYIKQINLNKKTKRLSRLYNKPLIANSDLHFIDNINYSFSLIDSKKDIESVIRAIKDNKIQLKTKPIKDISFIRTIITLFTNPVKQAFFSNK